MAKKVADNSAETDENGNGSSNRLPLIKDPAKKIDGIPRNKKTYHAIELRQISNRERKPFKPRNPVLWITIAKAAIAGAYTAR
jgi:hypothetical protein